MKKKIRLLLVLVLLIGVNIGLKPLREYWKSEFFTIPHDDIPCLELEEVYSATKNEGFGSVQSITITPDYFVIFTRPFGTAEMGGEKNNHIIVIDRVKMQDVTEDFENLKEPLDLGHANGVTYSWEKGELLVVDIADDENCMTMAARISEKDFKLKKYAKLPCNASGIAWDGEYFYARYCSKLRKLTSDLKDVKKTWEVPAELATQDIAYYNGNVYTANWANFCRAEEGSRLGLKVNQNLVKKVDLNSGKIKQYYILTPRQELEGIEFDTEKREVYFLFNGKGINFSKFYIYKLKHDETYDDFMNKE